MRVLLGGPPEYVVLCSPKQALLPEDVAVKFTGRAAVVTGETGTITYAYPKAEKDVPCKVVCKTFSIAEYATRCSGLSLKHDDVSPHTERPSYCLNDSDRALTVYTSRDRSWYVEEGIVSTTVYHSGRDGQASIFKCSLSSPSQEFTRDGSSNRVKKYP
jgi:hypothetical protein